MGAFFLSISFGSAQTFIVVNRLRTWIRRQAERKGHKVLRELGNRKKDNKIASEIR